MNKEKLKKLKKKVAVLGLLTTMGISSLNVNTAHAEEKNISVETSKKDDNKENEIEKYIKYYSDVYGLKEESIYDMLDHNLYETENSENVELNEKLVIETALDVYYSGTGFDENKSATSYEVTMEPEEMLEKYAEIFGINKEVGLAIMYTECGSSMASENYLSNNNPAGIGPHMYFENKEIGIIYFVRMLKYNYGCEPDSGIGFLRAIAPIYCDESWLNLTEPFYNTLSADFYAYAPDVREKKQIEENKKREQERIQEMIDKKEKEAADRRELERVRNYIAKKEEQAKEEQKKKELEKKLSFVRDYFCEE